MTMAMAGGEGGYTDVWQGRERRAILDETISSFQPVSEGASLGIILCVQNHQDIKRDVSDKYIPASFQI
jgi:hypothetical protein